MNASLNAGYNIKLEEISAGDRTYYYGYVYITVWHQIFPILPDYYTINMMINSPINLTYADNMCIGFNTMNVPYDLTMPEKEYANINYISYTID